MNSEQEEQERQRRKDAALNERLMYMFQLQNLAAHKSAVTSPNGEIGNQAISVVNPHQVSLMQTELPDKNPDIPWMGSNFPKLKTSTRSRPRFRPRVLPLRGKFQYRRRPKLMRSVRLRPVNERWSPTLKKLFNENLSKHF